MAEMARRWSLSVVLALMLASSAPAMTWTFGDIEITPEPPPKGNSWHGYSEYVFHVHNKSTEQPHTVSLSIPFEKRYSRDDSIRELRRTMQVGTDATVRLSLLQPDHPPISGTDVEVTIDGRRQDREIQLNVTMRYMPSRYGYPYHSMHEPLILMGPRVQPFPTTESAIPSGPGGVGFPGGMPGFPGMPGGGGMAPPPGMPAGGPGALPPRGGRERRMPGGPAGDKPPGRAAESELDLPPEAAILPAVMPPLWDAPAGLGIWSAMVVAKKFWELGEWTVLTSKTGLPSRGLQFVHTETWSSDWLAYSRYDGIVLTAADLKSVPPEVRAALWQYVETGGTMLVLGKTDLSGLSARMESGPSKDGWMRVPAGFGICHMSPDDNYAKWSAERFLELAKDWNATAAVWEGRPELQGVNSEFPIIEDLGIPIKGLFVLMFLFTLAIGPINLLVLTHQKRRIWLLWTTPVISLVTCLAVFAYMLISEGWQGRLRTETLTLLDETTHRATTIGWTGVYSPLTPGDGLHFSYDTEVTPQRYDVREKTSGARSCTIDLSKDQHFAAGWVEARVPALFKVRKSEMRRERVALERQRDGRWRMVNGLSAAIRRFWYADDKGQIHKGEDIAAGARVLLQPSEQESQAPTMILGNTLSSPSWIQSMKQISLGPQRVLRPGNYFAEVDESPFLEDALRQAKNRKVHALIVGFRQQEK